MAKYKRVVDNVFFIQGHYSLSYGKIVILGKLKCTQTHIANVHLRRYSICT